MTEAHATNLGRALCLGGAILGALALVGWFEGLESLATVVPGRPRMPPDAAFALMLLGIAGALLDSQQSGGTRRLFTRLIAIIVIIIGVEIAVTHALGVQLPLDRFFSFRDGAPPTLGRRSPPTAVALICLGAAILFFDWRRDKAARPSDWLILCAGLVAMTALLGHFYGAHAHHRGSDPIYGLAVTIRTIRALSFSGELMMFGVSVPGALGGLMICVGLLLERPDSGVMSILNAPGPGSALLKRLAPVAILIPVLFGFLAARVPGVEDVAFAFAALTAIAALASLFLLGITAAHLNRAHKRLDAARARTRDLIEHASDGIVIADLNGRYIDVNAAACRMLGYSREELLTKTVEDLILPEERARLRSHKSQLLKGATDVVEWTLRHKDGSHRFVEISAKILPDGRWEGLVRDVSERKRAEEALRLSEAKFSGMVSTSADAIISIDEGQRITLFNRGAEKIFGYSSAEMIGAPLDKLIPERFREIHARHVQNFIAGPDCARQASTRGTIFGLRRNGEEFPADASISKLTVGGKSMLSVTLRDTTETRRLYQAALRATRLRDEVLGIVAHDLRNPLQVIAIDADSLRRIGPEPVSQAATEIGDAASRMRRLIQDLVDTTSIESGHLSLKPEWLHVAEIVSETLHLQTPLALSALLELRVVMAPDLPDIWADHDRILQVFENLIGNAIKFTKAGGSITLRAVESADKIVFSVSDSGSGIAENDLSHVFDRFWRGSERAHKGAGFGLAIVKGIVEAHYGRIWVRSSVGQGTTFFFSIPIVPQARPRLEARTPRVDALPVTAH